MNEEQMGRMQDMPELAELRQKVPEQELRKFVRTIPAENFNKAVSQIRKQLQGKIMEMQDSDVLKKFHERRKAFENYTRGLISKLYSELVDEMETRGLNPESKEAVEMITKSVDGLKDQLASAMEGSIKQWEYPDVEEIVNKAFKGTSPATIGEEYKRRSPKKEEEDPFDFDGDDEEEDTKMAPEPVAPDKQPVSKRASVLEKDNTEYFKSVIRYAMSMRR
jgi:hypothetical protein